MICEKCGKEVCSCLADSYRLVYQDLLRRRDLLVKGLASMEELVASEGFQAPSSEGIVLNMDLETAGKIGLFDWLRSKGFEASKPKTVHPQAQGAER